MKNEITYLSETELMLGNDPVIVTNNFSEYLCRKYGIDIDYFVTTDDNVKIDHYLVVVVDETCFITRSLCELVQLLDEMPHIKLYEDFRMSIQDFHDIEGALEFIKDYVTENGV